MCLNNKIVATNCSENTKQLKIRLPFFVKTKVIRTYSFLLFLLSRKMHGIQRTVPEDICKPEYICIFYWLFISVHILLVQTQTVLEVLRPQRHLHTWAMDPSSLPGFLEGQIHTWIWRALGKVKADFTEHTEWWKSGLIWSWWDESAPTLGTWYSSGLSWWLQCLSCSFPSHLPTLGVKIIFPQISFRKWTPKVSKVKVTFGHFTLIQTISLTFCSIHAFIT